MLEEKREKAQMRVAVYQQRAARYYNSRVRERTFRVGDLVLRKVLPNTRDPGAGVLGANWEGPYQVAQCIPSNTYKLARMDDTIIP